MPKKLLLIGPRFHYFLSSVGRAFEACGYEVRTVSYDIPIHPYTEWNKLRYKLARDKAALKQQSRERYQPFIEGVFRTFQPEVVFVLNGEMLLPDTVQHFRCSAKVGIWLFDSITHMPDCGPCLPYADAVFCYEQQDIPFIKKKYGVKAHFLPQAVDETLYHPMAQAEKKWDIVFAGDLVHSAKRRRIIQTIVANYPHLRIRVWGIYKLWFKNPWKWLTRERRDVYTNCNTSAEQLNADYNAARIVLNIHHEQQKEGANPKVYEIAASGAYQICDSNPYIESLFPHGEIGLYENAEQLFARIDYALSHDMSAQSAAARCIISASHTYIVRMQQALQIIVSTHD